MPPVYVTRADLKAALDPLVARLAKLEGEQAPVPPPPPPPTVQPLWSDEFTTLDLSTATRVGTWRPNDFWQNINRGYRDFAGTSWNANPNETALGINPFTVANGVLTINTRQITATERTAIQASMQAQGQSGELSAWTGGMLASDPRAVTFRYGYFEVRARLRNPRAGMFPAIWLYAAGWPQHVAGKEAAEIDIAEVFGNRTGTPVVSNRHGSLGSGAFATTAVDTTQWHTYGLDWQAGHIRMYVDGVLRGSVPDLAVGWYDAPMSLRLNYAFDAPWFAEKTPAQTGGANPAMDVDWVRVWKVRPS